VLLENILLFVGDGSHTFHLFMCIVRCYGRISTTGIMNEYVMTYFLQFTKSYLVKKHNVFLSKEKIL
jgi:hypothetical protein